MKCFTDYCGSVMGCSPRARKRREETRIGGLCKVSPRTGLSRCGLTLAGSSSERLGGRPSPSPAVNLGTNKLRRGPGACERAISRPRGTWGTSRRPYRDSRVDGRPEFLRSPQSNRASWGIGRVGHRLGTSCEVARLCRPQRMWCRSRAHRPSRLESGSGAPVSRMVARWAESPRSH